MTPKMEIFNFGLDQKLDHHFCVEFHNDSDDDGFKAENPKTDPQIDPQIGLNDPKNEIFRLWTRKKVRPTYM